MRLGLDLDGVTYDFISAMRAYLGTRPYVRVGDHENRFAEPDRWNVWECWDMPHSDWESWLRKGAEENILFRHGAIYEGALSVLNTLHSEGHSIHIVTDRNVHPHAHTSTALWLAEQGIPYDSLTFSADKTVVPVDVFIEDSPANAAALEAAGVQVLLMDRPWNRGVRAGTRIHGWRSVLDEIELADAPGLVSVAPVVEFPGRRGQGAVERSATGGEKGQKAEQSSLVPVSGQAAEARVYAFGAHKYDRDNWRKGYEWHLAYDAAMRHLWSFWGGEDCDPESGEPHPAHVKFHMNTLIEFMETHPEYDDRP